MNDCICQKEQIIASVTKDFKTHQEHVDKRLNLGELRFQAMDAKLDTILSQGDAVARLEKRMYHDNGTTSIQTRLDRTDRIIKTIIWFIGAVVLVLLGEGILLIGKTVSHFLTHGV